VFTARYALSPYIKQIRFVFKGLILTTMVVGDTYGSCQRQESVSLHDISHWSPRVLCFFCKKPEVKFMHSCNRTEHYRK
jgi:hypothetical protein